MIECQELKGRKWFFLSKKSQGDGGKKVNARHALVVIYFNLFILNSFLN